MAEPLKAFFSPELVRRLARDIARVEPQFPARAFIARASAGLDELELLDRGKHIATANGNGSPKVFKLERVELPARARVELATRVSLAVHTTRKPRPGTRAVDVLVNGRSMQVGTFDVAAEKAAPERSRARR